MIEVYRAYSEGLCGGRSFVYGGIVLAATEKGRGSRLYSAFSLFFRMRAAFIEQALINGKRICNPITNCKPREQAGYYSIWLKDGRELPSAFHVELCKRNTSLLYIGRAKDSLLKRLLEQELQHKNPATFFRSLGAVLGYRPMKGSLVGKKNQNNYTFSAADTKAIISWIDNNLEVSFVEAEIESSFEEAMITKYSPLLNWTHSLMKFQLLRSVKDECRLIARS